EPPVLGAIDHPHSPATDLAVQLVVGAEHAFDVRTQLGVRGGNDRIRQSGDSGLWADAARMTHFSTRPKFRKGCKPARQHTRQRGNVAVENAARMTRSARPRYAHEHTHGMTVVTSPATALSRHEHSMEWSVRRAPFVDGLFP